MDAATALAKANEPVPDMVKQFVVYFYRHIREKNGAPRRPTDPPIRATAADHTGGSHREPSQEIAALLIFAPHFIASKPLTPSTPSSA
jgi:hypothetical protein